MITDRLVLGTVQLGLPYGIGNKSGQPSLAQAKEIVTLAYKRGITGFDTAQSYGTSEEILGVVFKELGIADQVQVVTKFDARLDFADRLALRMAIEASLKRLGVKNLAGVLMHNEQVLDVWHHGLSAMLNDFVRAGLTRAVGISVYSPERALQAVGTDGIDFIQVPSNILDKRFERACFFSKAQSRHKQVYVRSVFVQGLLLMAPSEIPPHLSGVSKALLVVSDIARDLGCSIQTLAISYAFNKWPSAKIIFGAETAAQVERNADGCAFKLEREQIQKIDHVIPEVDEYILNPSRWIKQ